MRKLVVLAVFVVVAVVLGMGLARGEKKSPSVHSEPLSCYQQGEKMVCLDTHLSSPQALTCRALSPELIYCASRSSR